jgi:adenylate cyclase
LSEDLTTLLARIPGFFVVSRGSALASKDQLVEPRVIARKLGVRYVVEGSLRPVAKKIRVTVQLIDADTNNHLWAERFDRDADDILDVQDEITQGIVARIEPALARAEFRRLERRPPKNLDSWELYQRAHGLLTVKGWARETFDEAIDLMRQAVDLDPDFAIAHAYLSLMLAVSHMFGLSGENESVPSEAADEASKAVDLDGHDSTVLGFAGCALCDIGLSQRGVALLERAVESDPSNAQAWAALGVGLIRTRKMREGVDRLQHGIAISPLDSRLAYWGTILANALFRLRRYDEALRAAKDACGRDDRFANSRVVTAMILTRIGQSKAAEDAMQEARRIFPGLGAEHVRGLIGARGVRDLEAAGLLAGTHESSEG